jgi:hypothetical protein
MKFEGAHKQGNRNHDTLKDYKEIQLTLASLFITATGTSSSFTLARSSLSGAEEYSSLSESGSVLMTSILGNETRINMYELLLPLAPVILSYALPLLIIMTIAIWNDTYLIFPQEAHCKQGQSWDCYQKCYTDFFFFHSLCPKRLPSTKQAL